MAQCGALIGQHRTPELFIATTPPPASVSLPAGERMASASGRSNSSMSERSIRCRQWKFKDDHPCHDFAYDLYIAYSTEDEGRVCESVISVLEENDYKCSYEAKTFTPGQYNVDNILEALKTSYKTLLVLTDQFINSGELDFITSFVIDDDMRNRFVVLNLDNCEIPKRISKRLHGVQCLYLDPSNTQDFYRAIRELFESTSSSLSGESLYRSRCNNVQVIYTRGSTSKSSSSIGLITGEQSEHNGHEQSDMYGEKITAAGKAIIVPKHSKMRNGKSFFGRVQRATQRIRNLNVDNPSSLIGEKRSVKRSLRSPVQLHAGEEEVLQIYAECMKELQQGFFLEFDVQQFTSNPKSYIDKANQVTDSSLLDHIENELLRMLDDSEENEHTGIVTLAYLSCFKGVNTKLRSLNKLNGLLVEDGFCAENARGLVEAEEILSNHLCDLRLCTLPTQMKYIHVYGRLLVNLILHKQMGHLAWSPKPLSDEGKSQICAIKTASNTSSGCFRRILRYRVDFVLFVIANRMEGGMLDTIWPRVQKLEQTCLNNFECWKLPIEIKQLDKGDEVCYYLDVFLTLCGRKVIQQRMFVYALIRILQSLINIKPLKKPDRSNLGMFGLLLTAVKILGNVAVNHRKKEIRKLAMTGFEDCSGLRGVWKSEFYRKNQDFQNEVQKEVASMLFKVPDKETRNVIIDAFFVEVYDSFGSGCNDRLCTDKMQLAVTKQITGIYESIGHNVKPITAQDMFEIQKYDGGISKLDGTFDDETVKIVVQRLVERKDLEKDFSKGASCVFEDCDRRLMNDIQTLSDLQQQSRRCKYIVEQIAKPDFSILPFHHITECLESGNLRQYLFDRRGIRPRLSKQTVLLIGAQVCKALSHLHHVVRPSIIHRDICLENVQISMVSEDRPLCKLENFHLALRNTGDSHDVEGSPEDSILVRWSAPESLHKNKFSEASDVYMYGCFLFELFTYACVPFYELRELKEFIELVQVGNFNYVLPHLPCIPQNIFKKIIRPCTVKSANRRTLTFKQLDLGEFRHALNEAREHEHHSTFKNSILPPLQELEEMERRTPSICEEIKRQIDDNAKVRLPVGHFATRSSFMALEKPDVTDRPESYHSWMSEDKPKFRRTMMVENLLQNENTKIVEKLRRIEFGKFALAEIIDIRQNCILVKQPKMNVLDYILQNRDSMTRTLLIKWMIKLGDALQYLHESLHIVHRDLQAQYVYVYYVSENQVEVKLSRYARCGVLSKSYLDNEGMVVKHGKLPLDSLRWYPLEVIQNPDQPFFTRLSDVYMYVMVCWQMMYTLEAPTGTNAWQIVPYPNLQNKITVMQDYLKRKVTPDQPKFCPDYLYFAWKKAWQEKVYRPSLDLLLDAMRARCPFESMLLKKLTEKFKENESFAHVDFNYSQEHTAECVEEGVGVPCDEEARYLLQGAYIDRHRVRERTSVKRTYSVAPLRHKAELDLTNGKKTVRFNTGTQNDKHVKSGYDDYEVPPPHCNAIESDEYNERSHDKCDVRYPIENVLFDNDTYMYDDTIHFSNKTAAREKEMGLIRFLPDPSSVQGQEVCEANAKSREDTARKSLYVTWDNSLNCPNTDLDLTEAHNIPQEPKEFDQNGIYKVDVNIKSTFSKEELESPYMELENQYETLNPESRDLPEHRPPYQRIRLSPCTPQIRVGNHVTAEVYDDVHLPAIPASTNEYCRVIMPDSLDEGFEQDNHGNKDGHDHSDEVMV